MEDRSFSIYSDRYVYLNGEIKSGKLYLESMVYGEDYDSEQHMEFSVEDTNKLFSLMPFDDFISFMRKNYLIGFDKFLKENDIKPKIFTI